MDQRPRVRALGGLRVLVETPEGTEPIPHQLRVAPKSVSIDRNSAREPDGFTIEVHYRDFPFDPRAIRFAQVAIHMGDVADNADTLPMDRSTLRFVGVVDKLETSLSNDGEVVRIEGRDYTSYFLDAKWVQGAIAINRPLGDVVSEFLSHVPGVEVLPHFYSRGAERLVLADTIGHTLYTPQEGDDAWTVLSDLCGLAGLIPVVELDALYIVTADDFGIRFSDEGDDIPPLRVRFTYGWDLERLTFGREYNEAASHQIQITCWDPERRETRIARWPEEGIVLERRIGADGKETIKKAAILPFFKVGSYSDDRLRELARRIYDERAREQIQGTFETGAVRDIDGVELLSLANGHRVTLKFEPDTVLILETMTRSEGIRWLVARGFDPDVAAALMDAKARADRIAVRFYVRRAKHTWSVDDGYRLRVEFINLVGGT